jgi:hypothetical protein
MLNELGEFARPGAAFGPVAIKTAVRDVTPPLPRRLHCTNEENPAVSCYRAESRGVVGFEVILGAYSPLSIAAMSSLSPRS